MHAGSKVLDGSVKGTVLLKHKHRRKNCKVDWR